MEAAIPHSKVGLWHRTIDRKQLRYGSHTSLIGGDGHGNVISNGCGIFMARRSNNSTVGIRRGGIWITKVPLVSELAF